MNGGKSKKHLQKHPGAGGTGEICKLNLSLKFSFAS